MTLDPAPQALTRGLGPQYPGSPPRQHVNCCPTLPALFQTDVVSVGVPVKFVKLPVESTV